MLSHPWLSRWIGCLLLSPTIAASHFLPRAICPFWCRLRLKCSSDAGELTWSFSPRQRGSGVVVIDTEKSQGLIGYCGALAGFAGPTSRDRGNLPRLRLR